MLKKAGIVAATAAGFMLLAAPAFASTTQGDEGGWHNGHGWGPGGQIGLVNTGNIDIAHNVSVPICATGNDIAGGVVPVVVDVLSPKGTVDSCNSSIATGDSGN